nr:MAG TPA: hypothetical protein [Caudoviricetes sp.]
MPFGYIPFMLVIVSYSFVFLNFCAKIEERQT